MISLFVSCSNDSKEQDVTQPQKRKVAEYSAAEEEVRFAISPEENEALLTEGIRDILLGNTTFSEFIETYRVAAGIDEIVIPGELVQQISNGGLPFCQSSVPGILDIEDKAVLQDVLRYETQDAFSAELYEVVSSILSALSRGESFSVDYGIFSDDEAYLVSYFIASCNVLNYIGGEVCSVSNSSDSKSDSDCTANLRRTVFNLLGYYGYQCAKEMLFHSLVLWYIPGLREIMAIITIYGVCKNTYELCYAIYDAIIDYRECMGFSESSVGPSIHGGFYGDNPEDRFATEIDWAVVTEILQILIINKSQFEEQVIHYLNNFQTVEL